MQSHRLSSSPVHTYHHRSNSVASMSLPHLSAGITPSDNHSYGDVRTLPFPPAPKLIAPSPTGSDSSERNTDILSYLGIDQSAHHRLSDPNHALARENRSCMASTNNGEWTPSPDQRVYPPLGERKERKVQHDYTDYSPIVDPALAEDKPRVGRGGVVVPFPEKLHNMLEAADIEGFHEIVSWQPHGRAFCVHKPQRFVERIMRSHFRQTKLTSFQRQLNLYGFRRITKGKDSGAYYHEMFMRSRPDLCRNMLRIKVKGTGSKVRLILTVICLTRECHLDELMFQRLIFKCSLIAQSRQLIILIMSPISTLCNLSLYPILPDPENRDVEHLVLEI